MLQENEKGGESAQSGTAKIGAIMLALASFCSSCKNDSNGFSNYDLRNDR